MLGYIFVLVPLPLKGEEMLNYSCYNETNDRKYKIALLRYSTYPLSEGVQTSFTNSLVTRDLDRQFRHIFRIFDSSSDTSKFNWNICEILNIPFDLIFSIGTECSLRLNEIAQDRKSLTPILFSDIRNPWDNVKMNQLGVTGPLIAADHQYQTTGVARLSYYYEEQLFYFLTLFPQTKKILIVYDPEQDRTAIQADKKGVEAILHKKNVATCSLSVLSQNEIEDKLDLAIEQHKPDAILTMYDTTTMAYMRNIVEIADRYDVLLCTAELESVNFGAMFGYGAPEDQMGKKAAEMAYAILERNINPRKIKIEFFDEKPFPVVNLVALQKRGIILDEALLKRTGTKVTIPTRMRWTG